MKERRKQIMKRMVIEELERREMLTGPPQIAMASTGLTNNSYEDFYKAQVGTEIGGPAGVGMTNSIPGTAFANTFRAAADNTIGVSSSALADTGVGQMVITTGANTPGIGSFAMPIAGPSRAGGTGSPAGPSPDGLFSKSDNAAIDAAIEELFTEPEELAESNQKRDAESTKVSERPEFKTGRRAFDLDAEEADRHEPQPVGK
jgi:hypothetical protein